MLTCWFAIVCVFIYSVFIINHEFTDLDYYRFNYLEQVSDQLRRLPVNTIQAKCHKSFVMLKLIISESYLGNVEPE